VQTSAAVGNSAFNCIHEAILTALDYLQGGQMSLLKIIQNVAQPYLSNFKRGKKYPNTLG
jgi:hypothetical protein